MKKCLACDSTKGQFWYLKNYFGISGSLCSPCYDKVSHDSYGKPNRPGDYLLMLMKFGANK